VTEQKKVRSTGAEWRRHMSTDKRQQNQHITAKQNRGKSRETQGKKSLRQGQRRKNQQPGGRTKEEQKAKEFTIKKQYKNSGRKLE